MRVMTSLLVLIIAAAPSITNAFEIKVHELSLKAGEISSFSVRNRFKYHIVVRVSTLPEREKNKHADVSAFPRRISLHPGQSQVIKVRSNQTGTSRLGFTYGPAEAQDGIHARVTFTIPVEVHND